MTIYLITKNQGKIKAAKSIFDPYGIELKNLEKEYPEIQADTSLEIARFTALQAAKEFNVPAIREDHSFYINAFGIPGPYMNFVERKLSLQKLLSLLKDENDRTGYFEIATVYAESNEMTKEFVYQIPFTLKTEEAVKDPRGGWNGIICVAGETRALTEYPEEERLHLWNKNYKAIAEYLSSKK